jgi:predicted esterase
MQAVRSDGIGGRGVTYIPSSGSYKNVVVWMHGLGDTADGWAAMMPTLGLSDTKFVLPTATNLPITINGGMAMPGKNLCFQSPSFFFILIYY